MGGINTRFSDGKPSDISCAPAIIESTKSGVIATVTGAVAFACTMAAIYTAPVSAPAAAICAAVAAISAAGSGYGCYKAGVCAKKPSNTAAEAPFMAAAYATGVPKETQAQPAV